MGAEEIRREERVAFFDEFSREHGGEPVTAEAGRTRRAITEMRLHVARQRRAAELIGRAEQAAEHGAHRRRLRGRCARHARRRRGVGGERRCRRGTRGLVFRPRRRILRMGADSLVVLVMYAAGIVGLFAIAGRRTYAGAGRQRRMSGARETHKPVGEADRAARRRSGLKGEIALALLPTVTVLVVFALVEAFSHQRLLFASLASSAFLIYRDPRHEMNSLRALLISQAGAALVGYGIHLLLGPGYLAGGVAMTAVVLLMILLDAVHPPAVSTALGFAFSATNESNLLLFGSALAITAGLVAAQRAASRSLKRSERAP